MHDLLVEMGRRLSVETLISSEDPIDQVCFNIQFEPPGGHTWAHACTILCNWNH